jgi:hypothetical protein
VGFPPEEKTEIPPGFLVPKGTLSVVVMVFQFNYIMGLKLTPKNFKS